MAEICVTNNCKQENETLFKRITAAAGKKQKVEVSLVATLTFAAGFTVGRCLHDGVNSAGEAAAAVPDLTFEVGSEAFISSLLCCVASLFTYIAIRREPTSTWKLHDMSLFSLVLAVAALAFVVRMYAVLTLPAYTHLWVAGAAVGLAGLLLFGFSVYVRAYRLALGIGLSAIFGHLLNPSQTRPHGTDHTN